MELGQPRQTGDDGAARRCEPLHPQPAGTTARIHQHLNMGEVDFDELFRELRANGFDGTLTTCVFAREEKAKESSLFRPRRWPCPGARR
ncbi:hypothetical protein GCM10018780_73240 [Streptomyces lanatus]|nr:hypothetical protein GCM10018780_73240 [Streptomyces lanatus]